MNQISFEYAQSCLISHDEIKKVLQQLQSEIDRINEISTDDFETEYASINLPFAENKHIKKIVEEKNKEILSSIRYAKRIQTSLLPTTIYIEKALKRLQIK